MQLKPLNILRKMGKKLRFFVTFLVQCYLKNKNILMEHWFLWFVKHWQQRKKKNSIPVVFSFPPIFRGSCFKYISQSGDFVLPKISALLCLWEVAAFAQTRRGRTLSVMQMTCFPFLPALSSRVAVVVGGGRRSGGVARGAEVSEGSEADM